MEPTHRKSSNYNATTNSRFFAGRAITSIALLDENKISNEDKDKIKCAEQHLKQAHLLLDSVSKGL